MQPGGVAALIVSEQKLADESAYQRGVFQAGKVSDLVEHTNRRVRDGIGHPCHMSPVINKLGQNMIGAPVPAT